MEIFLYKLILISVVSYLIGSFPTAYLLVKKFTAKDIREVGSGNVGAMNVARALKEKSKKLTAIGFLAVLIIDMAKGALAVFLAPKILLGSLIALILAAFFVILGHNYSIFLKFSGGRGAACLIGILVYLDKLSFLVWGLIMIIASVIAQIVLEKIGLTQKIHWRKISEVISLLGKQMIGRMAGLIFAPLFIYFYNPQIFPIAAVGTILLLIKNIPRVKGYLKNGGQLSND